MKTGEDLYCKVHQSQIYRASFSRHIRNMDLKILQIPKRENPPTIKADKASSTGKPVAHFSSTHVAIIPEKVNDGSSGKPVAVTLIQEFQVYLTQPSRKKTRIARKPWKNWFNSSRITRTGTRWYSIWTRLKRSIRSAQSRRSWSRAWATRNTSSFARLLLRYNALIALYLLHMRQVHAAYRKDSTVEQGKIRRLVNSRLRPGYVIKKESYPWCQTWTICAADVLQSTWYAEESPQAQKWW